MGEPGGVIGLIAVLVLLGLSRRQCRRQLGIDRVQLADGAVGDVSAVAERCDEPAHVQRSNAFGGVLLDLCDQRRLLLGIQLVG